MNADGTRLAWMAAPAPVRIDAAPPRPGDAGVHAPWGIRTRRYFVRDIISPEVELNPVGSLTIPRGAGLGFETDVA